MALDKNLLAKVKAGFKKQAFVPAGGDPAAQGGAPAGGGMPVDPATGMPIDPATGMPIDPATGMPIDPAMLGGGMPPPGMDPAMMGGGMPPAPPPTPPDAAGAQPPEGAVEMSPEGEPYIKLTLSQLLAAIEKIIKLTQKIGGGAPQPAQPDATGTDTASELRDIKTLLMSSLGGGM